MRLCFSLRLPYLHVHHCMTASPVEGPFLPCTCTQVDSSSEGRVSDTTYKLDAIFDGNQPTSEVYTQTAQGLIRQVGANRAAAGQLPGRGTCAWASTWARGVPELCQNVPNGLLNLSAAANLRAGGQRLQLDGVRLRPDVVGQGEPLARSSSR